jgi:exopolysaccharide production protein ExoQ
MKAVRAKNQNRGGETQTVGNQNGSPPNRLLSPVGILAIFLIVVCYWLIDHDWYRTQYYGDIDDSYYTGSENRTADQLSTVNPYSSISRLFLASFGGFLFLTAVKKNFRWSATPILFGALFGLALISVSWSILPKHTFFKFSVLTIMLITSLGFGARFSLRELLTIFAVVCLLFAIVGVAAELSFGVFRPWRPLYRFTGSCHPNVLAIYGSMIAIISRQFMEKSDRRVVLTTLLLCIGLAIIYLTKSRTTLAATLVGIIACQVIMMRGSNRIMLVASGFAVLAFLFFASNMISQQTAGAMGNAAAMGRSEDVNSLTGRLPLWEELLTWVSKRPMLGYGYMAFWDPERVEYLSETLKWEIPHAHNIPIDVMLDFGVIGLILFVVAVIAAVLECSRSYALTRKLEYAVLFGILINAIVNGMAESLFKFPGFPLFVLCACFASMLFHIGEETKLATK